MHGIPGSRIGCGSTGPVWSEGEGVEEGGPEEKWGSEEETVEQYVGIL